MRRSGEEEDAYMFDLVRVCKMSLVSVCDRKERARREKGRKREEESLCVKGERYG
jgi:hypothetical protein